MSDPLLPVPDADVPETDRERAEDVEDIEQPDVLPGRGDDERATEPETTAFRPPHAGDRLDDAELRRDLATE